MAILSRHKVWLVVSCGTAIAIGSVTCMAMYFIAVRSGASVRSAALSVAIILVLTLISVGVALARVIREPERDPLTVSRRAVFWTVTAAVVPLFASVLNLGVGVLVAMTLIGLEAVGLPVSDLRFASWATNGISLLSALGIWWFISKRYR